MPEVRTYARYRIDARPTPDIVPLPPRFRVKVSKHRLIGLVLKEFLQFRGNARIAMSRPCVYGVFSRPLGGLTPREEACVGCLRCTVQYPRVVQILPNPERERLGDAYLQPEHVDTILYEARTGRVPVRGAGYRGPFGGPGWDGMWLDMSEIVRPTRDGIHGREFISTAVDIGEKPAFVALERDGAGGSSLGRARNILSLQVPFLFDVPPPGEGGERVAGALVEAAGQIETVAFLPAATAARLPRSGDPVVPTVRPDEVSGLKHTQSSMLALDGWDPEAFRELSRRLPGTTVCVRVPAATDVLDLVRQGVRVVHLLADYHGRVGDRFVMDVIRETHEQLVQAGIREEVTLIGSGGIVLAEHVAKAIVCGLDAVALDSAVWAALQARFDGDCRDRDHCALAFPPFDTAWAVRRIRNLAASWRDQLLEVLGAMGLREVRRLRGELGRCMFQADLEREAFGDIEGFAAHG
jgi:hypothetical protein